MFTQKYKNISETHRKRFQDLPSETEFSQSAIATPFHSATTGRREYDGSAIFDPSLFVGALFRKSRLHQ